MNVHAKKRNFLNNRDYKICFKGKIQALDFVNIKKPDIFKFNMAGIYTSDFGSLKKSHISDNDIIVGENRLENMFKYKPNYNGNKPVYVYLVQVDKQTILSKDNLNNKNLQLILQRLKRGFIPIIHNIINPYFIGDNITVKITENSLILTRSN